MKAPVIGIRPSASWALSMLAAGKRNEGRWAYGESQNSDNLNREMKARLGVIADFNREAHGVRSAADRTALAESRKRAVT